MEHKNIVLALLTCVFAGTFCARADITTGWNKTEKGTYDFLSMDNWSDGVVSGVFSADWTAATGDIDAYLGADWTGSFKILGAVGAKTLVRASNGPCTVTLNDDLYLTPASMGADFVFGNGYEDKKKLNFDLGGATRTVYMNGGARWIFSDRISNGNLVFDGAGTFTFRSAGGSNGAITLSTNTVLKTGFTSSDKNDIDSVRASDLTLNRSRVEFQESQVNVTDRITETLTVLAEEPSCSILYPRATTADKTETVRIGSLEMKPGATLLVRGAKLGGDVKVLFDTAPETVGGIVPQLIGAKVDSDIAGLSTDKNTSYDQSFVSYDSTSGLVPLNLSSDYTSISGDISASANVIVNAGENFAVNDNISVNSLLLNTTAYNVAPGGVSGDGVLTISSGMVMAKPYKDFGKSGTAAQINAALNFGSTAGYVINAGGAGYRVRIGKPISGSAGLTLTHMLAQTVNAKVVITSGLGSYEIEGTGANSTYTGDTFIQSALKLNGNPFLPNGTRSGDVYVNGALETSSVDSVANVTVNGLYGTGLVYGRGDNLIVGDNNADGNFSGNVSIAGNTTVLSTLNKIGSGTQRLAGSVMLGSALNVNAGKVVLDGTVTQGAVNVAAGAAIGGNGSIATTLAFADGAKFDVDVADDVATCLNVAGEVTGGPVTVNANVTSGKWRTARCVLKSDVAITATFNRGAGVGALELKNNNTELWVSPKVPGLTIVFR